MRMMAVDYGDVRTGVAFCDVREMLATAYDTVEERYAPKLAEKLAALAKTEKAEQIVVGLPRNMDGSYGYRCDACRRLGSWRLHRCTMYVTLEPCPMCAGGIINARVDTVRYGTRDDKAGACGSVLNLFEERFNHHPRLYRGPLERECQEILQDFFQGLREDGAGENG